MALKEKIFTTSQVAEQLDLTHGRISQISRKHQIGEIVGNTRVFTQDDVESIRLIPDGRSNSGKKIAKTS